MTAGLEGCLHVERRPERRGRALVARHRDGDDDFAVDRRRGRNRENGAGDGGLFSRGGRRCERHRILGLVEQAARRLNGDVQLRNLFPAEVAQNQVRFHRLAGGKSAVAILVFKHDFLQLDIRQGGCFQLLEQFIPPAVCRKAQQFVPVLVCPEAVAVGKKNADSRRVLVFVASRSVMDDQPAVPGQHSEEVSCRRLDRRGFHGFAQDLEIMPQVDVVFVNGFHGGLAGLLDSVDLANA